MREIGFEETVAFKNVDISCDPVRACALEAVVRSHAFAPRSEMNLLLASSCRNKILDAHLGALLLAKNLEIESAGSPSEFPHAS